MKCILTLLTLLLLCPSLSHALGPVVTAPQLAPPIKEDIVYKGQPSTVEGELWKFTIEWRGDTGLCTGVFIAEDVVLTASHCAPNLTKGAEITLRFFKGTQLDHVTTREANEYRLITHPRFRENTAGFTNYDVALIVFKDSVVEEPWKTIDFMTAQYNSLANEGQKVLMVGIGGVSNEKHTYDNGVRFTNATIESYNGNTISVRGRNGSGICYGDSGGPVLVSTPEGYRLLGVLSGFFPTGLCDTSGLYTYFGAETYGWIQKTMDLGRAKFTN